MFGMTVNLTMVDGRTRTLRNITEVHSNYNASYEHGNRTPLCTAFESSIHSQGETIPTADILEYSVIACDNLYTAPENGEACLEIDSVVVRNIFRA